MTGSGSEDTAGQQAHEDKPRGWSGRAGDGRSRGKQGALAAEGCDQARGIGEKIQYCNLFVWTFR